MDLTQNKRKSKLWENESIETETNKQGIIVQLDANAHLGSEMIKNYPNPQN